MPLAILSMKTLLGRQEYWMVRRHQSEQVGLYKILINKVATACSGRLEIMAICAAERTGLPRGCAVILKSFK